MGLKISEGIEFQVVVETFLVVSVASLNLSVVPRSSRANELMLDVVSIAEHIKRMNTLSIEEMGELRAVIGLNGFGSITEKGNGALNKINGGVATVFFVCIDKPFSGCFLDDRVLIKLLCFFPNVANLGDILYVHLPFDTEHSGGIIRLIVQGLFLCGFNFLAETKTNKHAVERTGMTGIRLILTQLTVKFAQGDVGISSVVVLDPLQLLFGMGIRMRRKRTVRFGHKGILGPIITLIPSHQRGF